MYIDQDIMHSTEVETAEHLDYISIHLTTPKGLGVTKNTLPNIKKTSDNNDSKGINQKSKQK